MEDSVSRRAVIAGVAAAGALTSESSAQQAANIRGFDHVSLPMRNTDAMVAFYRRLGLQMNETANGYSVYVGNQMINFHRPARWQDPSFTLRAPSAQPPSGDVCFVWDGTPAALKATLDRAGAKIEEGPVERQGARKVAASSTYIRDPDGNLIEFMIYP